MVLKRITKSFQAVNIYMYPYIYTYILDLLSACHYFAKYYWYFINPIVSVPREGPCAQIVFDKDKSEIQKQNLSNLKSGESANDLWLLLNVLLYNKENI